MRVLLAFDKFKDSLTARGACEIARRALQARHPDWQLDVCPLADGGEGFCEILTTAARGEIVTSTVMGPRGDDVAGTIGIVPRKNIPRGAQTLLAEAGDGDHVA